MLLETLAMHPQKARRTNTNTAGSWAAKTPTATDPAADDGTATGSAAITLGPGAGQNGAVIQPYGLDASVDNKVFKMRVFGWHHVGFGDANPDTSMWIPMLLGEFECTCSAANAGATGKVLGSTEAMCDTIVAAGTTVNAGVSCDILSPANDTPGSITLDLKGCQKVELVFNNVTITAGGTATTSANAFISFV